MSERAESLVKIKDLRAFRKSIKRMKKELLKEGYDSDDVRDIVDLDIPIDNDEQREEIRKILYNTFHELHDNGRTAVIFEDECGDCFSKLINEKCPNQDCINNLYKMEG
ncbi:hypothetical protein CL617_00575 [archaeon]|nr:hypothetical protein [archaeon]